MLTLSNISSLYTILIGVFCLIYGDARYQSLKISNTKTTHLNSDWLKIEFRHKNGNQDGNKRMLK